MKLTIGENIRRFRKKNDLTQEALADRLGVTYQSISRWENGTTYPDLELIPAIAEVLAITADELLGMPQIEKEKRAEVTFDELRRACIQQDYDAERIISLLRDIRRNYMNSSYVWRPWVEGNDRAFRDPRILPEVRLFAEAYLERSPMDPHVIETMAEIEDEEHLQEFLDKYTAPFECSQRDVLFQRYLRRGDAERFEPERRFQVDHAFRTLLCPWYLNKMGEDENGKIAADNFRERLLSLIRVDAVDDRPDIWVEDRIKLGLSSAARAASLGEFEVAITQLEAVVTLLEETMSITDQVLLPTSCRFLDGMEWYAKEAWDNTDNNPDSPKERHIYIFTRMSGMCSCECIFPSRYIHEFERSEYAPLRKRPDFEVLRARARALVATKSPET